MQIQVIGRMDCFFVFLDDVFVRTVVAAAVVFTKINLDAMCLIYIISDLQHFQKLALLPELH